MGVAVPSHERSHVELTELKRWRPAERMVDIRAKPVHAPFPAKAFFAVAEAPEETHADGVARDVRTRRNSGPDGAAYRHFAGRLGRRWSGSGEDDQKPCKVTHTGYFSTQSLRHLRGELFLMFLKRSVEPPIRATANRRRRNDRARG